MSGKFKLIKLFFLFTILFATGCTHINATRNAELVHDEKPVTTKASFTIAEDRGIASPESKARHEQFKNTNETLFVLALSGGGSRAAYWSSEVMLNLAKVFNNKDHGDLDLLKEVDVISSVSGGSLPAAYYVISEDGDDVDDKVKSDRIWNQETVRDLMSNDYITRWFYNWFWPSNIAQYWFTGYDRSDIMAQTLADNLFDVSITGWDLKFKDINPERPNLILNATNGTSTDFGTSFTFTDDIFHGQLSSQLSEYDIAWAVMATASFPAVFNYMTLEDFDAPNGDKYVHVFDGGNTDNLGLESAKKVINRNIAKYKNIVVILVDAYTHTVGIDRDAPDARKYFDFVVDTNFLDSTDSLLRRARNGIVDGMKTYMGGLKKKGKNYVFYHIQFDDLGEPARRSDLHLISTNFKIRKKQRQRIEHAAGDLIVAENECLIKIKKLILNKSIKSDDYCQWQSPNVHKQEPKPAIHTALEVAQ